VKLNLGCGLQKLEGYINVDIDPALEPDEVFDFTGRFPYECGTVDEIVAYHVLEHIPKFHHRPIFAELYRVLVPNGRLVISFPEWATCVKYYQSNHKGMKEFWEATLYGRQASPHDFHVCIMERDAVSRELVRSGFAITYCGPEPVEEFNSVIKAQKDVKFTYQQAMVEAMGANTESK
jgi:SAM-dependent methyltransferase